MRRASRISFPTRAAFLVVTALASACAVLTGLEPPEHDLLGVAPDQAVDGADGTTPDRDEPAEVGTDATADAPTCATATETLPSAVDGNLTFGGSHQDLSGLSACNITAFHCLVAFPLVASGGKHIVSVTLHVPRATSAECGNPASCTDAVYQGAGTMTARHMRTDWTGKATWFKRTTNAADTWNADGALGSGDSTAVLAAVPVASANASVSITVDGSLLNPQWNNGTLAFQLASQTGGFEFVIQRVAGSSLNRPTLDVTYCTDANDGG